MGALLLILRPVVAVALFLNLVPLLIWMERKGCAYIQDRPGPNRAYIPGIGLRLAGMIHSLADVIKLAGKREKLHDHVSLRFFLLAPFLALFGALLGYAVIPFADDLTLPGGSPVPMRAVDLEHGVLYVFAAASLGVFAIIIAGWASNNKFALLGALRSSAQMISYEVGLGLAVAAAVLVYGTVDLSAIVRSQGDLLFGVIPMWGILLQPFGFLLYLTTAFAETNRTPFDLPEGESEIVGFHVEYSGFKFAMFYMAEYLHIATQSAIMVTVFFGGWQVPWLPTGTLVRQAPDIVPPLLFALAVGCGAIGLLALRYHARNRKLWTDARAREGVVLAVLLGFGPAVTALLLGLLLAGGALPDWGGPVFAAMLQGLSFFAKVVLMCWLFIWVRWTLPRFRYDQLMNLGWKILLPLGVINLFVTGLFVLLLG